MDKYDFTNGILVDLVSRLKKRKNYSKEIKLISLENFAGIKDDKSPEKKVEENVKSVKERIVLTENDVLKLTVNELILPIGSIITPLAKEAARKKGVNIEFEKR